MATSTTSLSRRLLLAGGFAAVVATAPLIAAGTNPAHAPAPLAGCPTGEVVDVASGACKPSTDKAPATMNPLNPENTPFQPGELTSSRPGDVGSLPEVDGIPCNSNNHGGGSSGECIGLQESQGSYHAPHASVNGEAVAPPPGG